MEQFDWSNPWFVSTCASVIGFVLGIAVMTLLQRRQAGGKSVEKLREEMEHYREEVSDHFAKTSDLFGELNEKYRDVYNHLAAGSQELCEDPMEHARLEFADAKAAISDDTQHQSGDDVALAESEQAQKNSSENLRADEIIPTDSVSSSKF